MLYKWGNCKLCWIIKVIHEARLCPILQYFPELLQSTLSKQTNGLTNNLLVCSHAWRHNTTNFTIKESHIQMILSTSGHVDFESGIDVLNAQNVKSLVWIKWCILVVLKMKWINEINIKYVMSLLWIWIFIIALSMILYFLSSVIFHHTLVNITWPT